MGFPDSSVGKESSCNAGDPGSIPGLGRSPGEGNSSILAWKIPWTEKSGSLQSMGSQRVGHDRATFTFLVAQMVRNLPAMQETQVQSLGQEDPLEK